MGNKRKVRCPTCKRLTQWKDNPYRPFCSRECKLADLYSWLNEEYSIKDPAISIESKEFLKKTPQEKGG